MELLYIISIFFLWSSTFSINKILVGISDPIFLTASRMIIASLGIILYLAFKKRLLIPLKISHWFYIICTSVIGIYLSNICEFYGYVGLSGTRVCLLYSLSPFITAILSYFHLSEKMSPLKLLGLSMGILGVAPGLLLSKEGLDMTISSFDIIAFLAVFLAAYDTVLLSRLLKNSSIPSLNLLSLRMLFGGSIALIHSLFVDNWNPIPIAEGSLLSFLKYGFLLLIISNVICYQAQINLLRKYNPTLISFIALLCFPLFSAINEFFILGVPIPIETIYSSILTAIGLAVMYRSELKENYKLQRENLHENY